MLSKQNKTIAGMIVFSLLILAVQNAKAGNLDSSGSPAATGYTLGDIWNRLETNQTASEGGHNLSPAANPASTFRTLKEIYESIPTILPQTVKLGNSYLGIAGTLKPEGGTAAQTDVCASKTFFGLGQANWDLQTGTLAVDGSKILSGTSYCGTNGQITNVGQQIITPSATNQSIDIGYHDGTGYAEGDPDLISGNVRSGVNLFGVNGNSNVVNTTSGDATTSDIGSGKIAWADGLAITGSADIYPFGDTDATKVLTSADSGGTYNATNLSAGTVKDGTTFGVGATGDYPSAIYPLDGDTGGDGNDAAAAQICNNYQAWRKTGGLITGSLNPSTNTIGSGNTICGVNGTLLKNQYNGSASSGDYPQSVGGVDDYNADHADGRPDDSYAGTWTACDGTNEYCGTSDLTNADKKDDSTGLIWSKWLDSGNFKTWFWANNCVYSGIPADCDAHNEVGCKCVKLTGGSKTGCEALAGGWRLPYQKELMQAYIDGSWNKNPTNLSSAGYGFWSATTGSYNTQNAWVTTLVNGYTSTNTKATSASYRVRCVR